MLNAPQGGALEQTGQVSSSVPETHPQSGQPRCLLCPLRHCHTGCRVVDQPRRVRMTRRMPWRHLAPDAVIVDRRSRWGNPSRSPNTAEPVRSPCTAGISTARPVCSTEPAAS